MDAMPHILIIEDDASVREVLKEALMRNGYEVSTAVNGKEGLELYQKRQSDLVIVDIIMPIIDGPDTIYELKKDFPKVKVIAISGGGKESGEDHLESTKILSCVKRTFSKPFAMDEFFSCVKELIG